jgi:hypothetical protein
MLSICENIGVEFGVEFGVSLNSGVASGVEVTIDAVGRGVGEKLLLESSRFPPVTIHAIKTPNKPITKTIASIHGNGLRRGRSSADSDTVWRPGK